VNAGRVGSKISGVAVTVASGEIQTVRITTPKLRFAPLTVTQRRGLTLGELPGKARPDL